MSYSITIMSAIDELQRCYRKLNEDLFAGELEEVIITIQGDVTSGAYAWITEGKVWSDKNKTYYREINMTAEHLQRPPDLIICSLLHEMCHLMNMQKGIKDTSRAGTYHNKEFKEMAITHMMNVEKSDKYGYCITTPTEWLSDWTKENCRYGCFRYKRSKTYKDGTPKTTKPGEDGKEKTVSKTKQSSIKYICPKCKSVIRATKNLDDKIICADCASLYVRIES